MTTTDRPNGVPERPLVKKTIDKDLGRLASVEEAVRPTAHRLAGLGLGLIFLIVAGGYADLVCLSGDDPMLVAHGDASRLDALVFSGYSLPIERVMVHGEWRVVDGRHVDQDEVRAAYAAAVSDLAPVEAGS